MATQTGYPANELGAYSAELVGACTRFVGVGVLSGAEMSGGGAASMAAPAGRSSSSGSNTATQTSSVWSGVTAGTTSTTATASSAKNGANEGLEGCGRLLGAVVAISCIFAPLYYQLGYAY